MTVQHWIKGAQFKMLAHYKQKYGDCRVPYYDYNDDPSLGTCVGSDTVRGIQYANNRLRADRRSKLESSAIGFVWVAGECCFD
jgi:hypothetical protein